MSLTVASEERACLEGEITVEAGQVGRLPSGRSVAVKVAGGREELEVRSPVGEVEVHITLTDQGAVVSLRACRLELGSTDTVAMHCRRFQVITTEGTDLLSDGDVVMTGRQMLVKTEGDIRMNGGIIHLNC